MLFRSLLSLTYSHPQSCAWANGIVAGLVERVGVQERIARTVRQCHEAEPFFRVEPLHGRIVLGAESGGGGPGRCGPRQVARRGTIEAEVIIEAAAPAWASAAAVGHVQEKIVPISYALFRGDRSHSGPFAGLLPHSGQQAWESIANFPGIAYRIPVVVTDYHSIPIVVYFAQSESEENTHGGEDSCAGVGG